MAESGQAIKHVFGSDGMVEGTGCQTLACASEVLVQCELGHNLPCS